LIVPALLRPREAESADYTDYTDGADRQEGLARRDQACKHVCARGPRDSVRITHAGHAGGEIENQTRADFRVSVFEFPVSNFQFPTDSCGGCKKDNRSHYITESKYLSGF
jgi:hypothetical protein